MLKCINRNKVNSQDDAEIPGTLFSTRTELKCNFRLKFKCRFIFKCSSFVLNLYSWKLKSLLPFQMYTSIQCWCAQKMIHSPNTQNTSRNLRNVFHQIWFCYNTENQNGQIQQYVLIDLFGLLLSMYTVITDLEPRQVFRNIWARLKPGILCKQVN